MLGTNNELLGRKKLPNQLLGEDQQCFTLQDIPVLRLLLTFLAEIDYSQSECFYYFRKNNYPLIYFKIIIIKIQFYLAEVNKNRNNWIKAQLYLIEW